MSPPMQPRSQILIVDDDEGITALLREYLARFGFEVHVAGDGIAMREQLDRKSVV